MGRTAVLAVGGIRQLRGSRDAEITSVAAGEAPLTIGYGPHARSFVNQGAPIEWMPLEPVVTIVSTVSIAQRPPHPAAARLFIDFLLSKTTQLKLREMSRIPARGDVESDPPRLMKGFKESFKMSRTKIWASRPNYFSRSLVLAPG